jgi:hypothetical protein
MIVTEDTCYKFKQMDRTPYSELNFSFIKPIRLHGCGIQGWGRPTAGVRLLYDTLFRMQRKSFTYRIVIVDTFCRVLGGVWR